MIAKKKVLILGGTGAMGTHLVNLFRETDNEVYVTSRRERKSSDNIHYLKGDAHDSLFLGELLKNKYDVIVDFMVYSTNKFENVYLSYLDNCKQYVYLSSSRAYANCDGFITEDSPLLVHTCKDEEYLDTDEYAICKGREEDILRNSGRNNYTIIRPYITYSEYRLQLGVMEKEDWLYRAINGRPIVFSSDIASKFTTLTYGLDVAKGIFSLLGNSKVLGEAFHIAGKPIKWQRVLDIYVDEITKQTGRKPEVVMTDCALNLSFPYLKWQVKYDRLYNRMFDNTKISQFIGIDKFVDTEEGLRKCTQYFLKNPQFKEPNWYIQSKYDRITGTYAKRSEFKTIKSYIKYLLNRFGF